MRELPKSIMAAIQRDFPKYVKATWAEKNNGLIEANVLCHGQITEVWYHRDGTRVEKTL